VQNKIATDTNVLLCLVNQEAEVKGQRTKILVIQIIVDVTNTCMIIIFSQLSYLQYSILS